jgi:hypothetical protein
METMWPTGLTVLALAVAAPLGLRWALPRWRERGQPRVADVDASHLSQRTPAKGGPPHRAASLQQRLQQRLVREKLDLEAQLRASKAALDRVHHDRANAETLLRQHMDQQMEALHQTHEANLRHLLAVYLEQIGHLHHSHAHHSQALVAELERQKALPPREAKEASEADTRFFNTVISDTAYATTSLGDLGFAPTTAMPSKAWS